MTGCWSDSRPGGRRLGQGRRTSDRSAGRRWRFGQFAATGGSTASYQQAEEPVSQLINEFGPPVASPAAARQRAAMPFVHLERDLWDLRDAAEKKLLRMLPLAVPGCWNGKR